MRVTRKELEERVTYVNIYLKETSKKNELHLEYFNGYTWLKDMNGNTIYVGTPKEVNEHLYTILRTFWYMV